MKKNRKNEEGAVLLLLIVMMSAVVLIVASLLRFNTQNIKFAAIEAKHEQALYLAEGVADSIDFFLLEKFEDEVETNGVIPDNDVSTYIGQFNSTYKDSLYGFIFPVGETYAGESLMSDLSITIDNPDNSGSFYPNSGILHLDITVAGQDVSRKISVTYEFPTAKPEDGYDSFISSKEMNYSNSL
jgi:hypothetical protein